MNKNTYILIVEDSPTQAMLLKRLLTNHGYQAFIAKNGKEALVSIRQNRPDLVISDIVMPEMDGYEMCRTIKNDHSLRDIPVILLTSLSDPEDVIRGLEARAEAYVTKPYNEDTLLTKVKAILEMDIRQEDDEKLEIHLKDKHYTITSNRQQIMNLLFFTYENAVQQNRELIKVQNELKKLNEQLEEKVEERTADLKAEIAERKRVEQSLKEVNERLKELDRVKSDFLSTVSHELRTPLAIIREGVSLCLDGVAGETTQPQQELLTNAQDNVDRLTRLINDLLDISKIEAQKVSLWRKSLNLCDLVQRVKKSFEQQAEKMNVQLKTDLPDKSIVLFADEDKVMQIFHNLLSNAVRYTEAGGEISIRVEEKEEEVLCSVSDTGIGITKENLPKLFSKFEQIGRVEGPGYKGTGLGLAIVKGLVEKHGGTIGVESELGRGSNFWFTLKKVPFPKILIVDDDENVVQEVRTLLSEDGYGFLEAYNGIDAVTLARKEHPDLIILDMVLPGMNGYEVIGRLKQYEQTQAIPILIISAYSVDEKRLHQIDIPSAIPIQKKPINHVELRRNVTELLIKE